MAARKLEVNSGGDLWLPKKLRLPMWSSSRAVHQSFELANSPIPFSRPILPSTALPGPEPSINPNGTTNCQLSSLHSCHPPSQLPPLRPSHPNPGRKPLDIRETPRLVRLSNLGLPNPRRYPNPRLLPLAWRLGRQTATTPPLNDQVRQPHHPHQWSRHNRPHHRLLLRVRPHHHPREMAVPESRHQGPPRALHPF